MASLVEALDLLGRAHTLQSQTIEPGDTRAVETRKDATLTLSSATRRWFSERTWVADGMGLTIVSDACSVMTLPRLPPAKVKERLIFAERPYLHRGLHAEPGAEWRKESRTRLMRGCVLQGCSGVSCLLKDPTCGVPWMQDRE